MWFRTLKFGRMEETKHWFYARLWNSQPCLFFRLFIRNVIAFLAGGISVDIHEDFIGEFIFSLSLVRYHFLIFGVSFHHLLVIVISLVKFSLFPSLSFAITISFFLYFWIHWWNIRPHRQIHCFPVPTLTIDSSRILSSPFVGNHFNLNSSIFLIPFLNAMEKWQ